MKITTKEIIKILPLEKTVKDDLLNKFDQLDPNRKYDIEHIVWDAYMALYKLRVEKNIQLSIKQARDGQKMADKDFYRQVREQTEKEMKEDLAKGMSHDELTQVREKIQTIIQQNPAA